MVVCAQDEGHDEKSNPQTTAVYINSSVGRFLLLNNDTRLDFDFFSFCVPPLEVHPLRLAPEHVTV